MISHMILGYQTMVYSTKVEIFVRNIIEGKFHPKDTCKNMLRKPKLEVIGLGVWIDFCASWEPGYWQQHLSHGRACNHHPLRRNVDEVINCIRRFARTCEESGEPKKERKNDNVDLLRICENHSHRFRITTQQVRSHYQS